jgi:hypothetical protein
MKVISFVFYKETLNENQNNIQMVEDLKLTKEEKGDIDMKNIMGMFDELIRPKKLLELSVNKFKTE